MALAVAVEVRLGIQKDVRDAFFINRIADRERVFPLKGHPLTQSAHRRAGNDTAILFLVNAAFA